MYHTLADITLKLTEATLIQLSDDAHSGAVDTTVTDDAARSAAAIIDGVIRAKYSLPLDSTPDILREISIALAIYDLYRRRMGAEVPKAIREERDHAMSLLDHIASGTVALFETDRSGQCVTNKDADDRVFSDEVLLQM